MKAFEFKRFTVEQPDKGLKVNTDGVILGATAGEGCSPLQIVDIGTGTGVIALMLAQRFAGAMVNAVEVDDHMAELADRNFKCSAFAARLQAHAGSFQDYFTANATQRYDLIVSNPPFFLDSLQATEMRTRLAKHTEAGFFADLVRLTSQALSEKGELWVITPPAVLQLIKPLACQAGLFLNGITAVSSFDGDAPVRYVSRFGRGQTPLIERTLTIYAAQKVYSEDYRRLLSEFLTIF